MTALAPRSPGRFLPMLGGWAAFIAIETVTQITMKYAGAGIDDDHGFVAMVAHAAASPITWLAFGLYFTGFLVWLTILKDVDLGRAFPMTAAVYVATLTAAVVLFHEHLNPIRVLGVLSIVLGVGFLASDENSGTREQRRG
jgi:multidrug transporter EmrE-like cation transporter